MTIYPHTGPQFFKKNSIHIGIFLQRDVHSYLQQICALTWVVYAVLTHSHSSDLQQPLTPIYFDITTNQLRYVYSWPITELNAVYSDSSIWLTGQTEGVKMTYSAISGNDHVFRCPCEPAIILPVIDSTLNAEYSKMACSLFHNFKGGNTLFFPMSVYTWYARIIFFSLPIFCLHKLICLWHFLNQEKKKSQKWHMVDALSKEKKEINLWGCSHRKCLGAASDLSVSGFPSSDCSPMICVCDWPWTPNVISEHVLIKDDQ